MQKEKRYRVTWEIDIWDSNPEHAAIEAFKLMMDDHRVGTILEVTEVDDNGNELSKSMTIDILNDQDNETNEG